jgi:hypothetical protein
LHRSEHNGNKKPVRASARKRKSPVLEISDSESTAGSSEEEEPLMESSEEELVMESPEEDPEPEQSSSVDEADKKKKAAKRTPAEERKEKKSMKNELAQTKAKLAKANARLSLLAEFHDISSIRRRDCAIMKF